MMLIAVAPVAARSLIAARVSGDRVPGPHQIYGFLTTEAKLLASSGSTKPVK
jgi:hypothetical protein